MERDVAVYGFGTAFSDAAVARDVDLLIVHHGTDRASCQLAIQCKRFLAVNITCAHITMLSDTEEAQFQFIRTARAIYLGTVRERHIDIDLDVLSTALPRLSERPSKLS